MSTSGHSYSSLWFVMACDSFSCMSPITHNRRFHKELKPEASRSRHTNRCVLASKHLFLWQQETQVLYYRNLCSFYSGYVQSSLLHSWTRGLVCRFDCQPFYKCLMFTSVLHVLILLLKHVNVKMNRRRGNCQMHYFVQYLCR